MTKSEKKHASKNTLALLLIALPGITYLIINNYIPIIGTFIAFKKFSYAKGIWGSPWCGLDNFKFLFLTDDAWVIIRKALVESRHTAYHNYLKNCRQHCSKHKLQSVCGAFREKCHH